MKGLSFKKTDLHVHTPASSCYKDDNYTPEKFVADAISKGIEVIAITDHNSGSGIDEIKKAALNKNLTIFPGVEITASEGFHIVAIFDVDKGSEEINEFLATKLGFTKNQIGKSDERNLDACSILKHIKQNGGIGIIAHADSDKVSPWVKISDAIKLKEILENKDYIAIETSDGRVPDFYTKKQIQKLPVVYRSSDNPNPIIPAKHSSAGIGARYSYFKFDNNNINLKSLRQCFIDPEVRIINDDAIGDKNYTYIEKIEIEGGFLDKQSIEFHNGLNSIIGGKGTGKSLIVEFIRFALENESDINEVRKDNKEKIAACLGKDGLITLTINAGGEKYEVTAGLGNYGSKIDLIKPSVICKNLSTGVLTGFDIGEFFKTLVYSQNEILSIAKDENALLSLLDSFVDFTEEDIGLRKLSQELEQINYAFVNSYNAKKELENIKCNINTQKEKIKKLDSVISKIASSNLQKIIVKRAKIKDQLEEIENAETFIQNIINSFENLEDNYKKATTESYKNPLLKSEITSFKKHYAEKYTEFKNNIKSKQKEIANKLKAEKKNLEKEWNKVQKEYNKEQGVTQKLNELNNQKDIINKVLKGLEESKGRLKEEADNFTKHKKERCTKIKNFIYLHKQKYNKRKELYDEITKLSGNKLKLELKESFTKEQYTQELNNLLRGTNLRNKDTLIENLLNKFSITELTEHIFNKNAIILAKALEGDERGQTIVDWLWQEDRIIKEFLNLMHKFYPQDTPVIQYNKNKNGKPNYADLDKLSVGQKSNALLIIALLKGDFPIIIDQPEDALDITSIWEDISLNLRKNKNQRQFILTTHNNCVAVASDTDNFISLKSHGDKGFVISKGGGIESSSDIVMEHLEGGIEPYKLRDKKYLLK